jgi:hypothetical protein
MLQVGSQELYGARFNEAVFKQSVCKVEPGVLHPTLPFTFVAIQWQRGRNLLRGILGRFVGVM